MNVKRVFDARPHPCPLPQERENYSPCSSEAKLLVRSTGFRRNPKAVGDSLNDEQAIEASRVLFPLPGGEGQGEGERQN